jgi:Tfp pilus assembly protein FimT
VTVIELTVVVFVVGILCVIGIPALLRQLDRTRVRNATNEIVSALSIARTTAILRGHQVAVSFDSAEARVSVTAGTDTILMRPVGEVYGVTLKSNRDSTAYSATGLGYGAANQTVVVSRGGVADTVIISRLGRVRR